MSTDEEKQETETGASADLTAQKRARQEQIARKAAERDLRLKAQLRANLQRRKAQTRARREGEEDSRPGDLSGLREER
jgi:hypothetical protein